MTQHNLIIPNRIGAEFRAEINKANRAILSGQSGPSAPANPVKYQRYIDSDNDHEYIWNGSRWVDRGSVF